MAERGRPTAAAKAEAAAAALDLFLEGRKRGGGAVLPHAHDFLADPVGAKADERTVVPERRREALASTATCGGPLRPSHPDWLHHEFRVDGPAEEVGAFAEAAVGSGTVPWAMDFDTLEEDWFHRLLTARDLSLTGSRILARQLREAVERRCGLASARVGRSRACPFDLHALVPVPSGVLARGPDHPDSLAWLWENWGTTEPLRHVRVGSDPARLGADGRRYVFWAADWSPWRALERLRLDWPDLRFDLRPRYDAG